MKYVKDMPRMKEISVQEKLADEIGVKLKEGRWNPKEVEVYTDPNPTLKKAMFPLFVALIILFALPVIVVARNPTVVIPCIAFLMFGLIIALVMYGSIAASPKSKKTKWVSGHSYRSPTIEVKKDKILLGYRPINFNNIFKVTISKGAREMEVHTMDRKVMFLDLYRYRAPNRIADAMKAAFEVNAILVEDYRGMDPLVPADFDMEAVARAERKRIRPRAGHERSEIEKHKAKIEEMKAIQKKAIAKKKMRKAFDKKEAEEEEEVIIQEKMVVEAGVKGEICLHCGAPMSEELLECPRCGHSL